MEGDPLPLDRSICNGLGRSAQELADDHQARLSLDKAQDAVPAPYARPLTRDVRTRNGDLTNPSTN